MQAPIGTSSDVLISFKGGEGDAFVLRFNGACNISLSGAADITETAIKAGEVVVLDPKCPDFQKGQFFKLKASAPIATTCSIDRKKYKIIPVANLQTDRNPADVSIRYGATIAPAGTTDRATYTVPSGRKALVQNAFNECQIVTVAAPAGTKQCNANIVIGGLGYVINRAELDPTKNTVGLSSLFAVAGNTVMLEGDTAKLQTYDGSTGGTVLFECAIFITEYDL